jgi:hypothetical protein
VAVWQACPLLHKPSCAVAHQVTPLLQLQHSRVLPLPQRGMEQPLTGNRRETQRSTFTPVQLTVATAPPHALPQNTNPVISCSSTRLSINSHEPPASRRPSWGCKQLQRQRRRAAFVAPAGDGGGICIRQVAIHRRPNRSHDQPPGVLCCSACSARVIDERCLRQLRSGLCSAATRQALCACRLCS